MVLKGGLGSSGSRRRVGWGTRSLGKSYINGWHILEDLRALHPFHIIKVTVTSLQTYLDKKITEGMILCPAFVHSFFSEDLLLVKQCSLYSS